MSSVRSDPIRSPNYRRPVAGSPNSTFSGSNWSTTTTEQERMQRLALKSKRENDAFERHVMRKKLAREKSSPRSVKGGAWDPPTVDTSWREPHIVGYEYGSSPTRYVEPVAMDSWSYASVTQQSFTDDRARYSVDGRQSLRYSQLLPESETNFVTEQQFDDDDDQDSFLEFQASMSRNKTELNKDTQPHPSRNKSSDLEVHHKPKNLLLKAAIERRKMMKRVIKHSKLLQESDVVDVVRRWKIRKANQSSNTSPTPPGTQESTSQLIGASYLAGVDELGRFMPRKQVHQVRQSLEDRVIHEQRKLLAQTYIRWKKFAIIQQKLNSAMQRVQLNRKKRCFDEWTFNYRAVCAWRLQRTSKALASLDANRRIRIARRTQELFASTHYRQRACRRALRRWHCKAIQSVSISRTIGSKPALLAKRVELRRAYETVQRNRLQKWFNVWSLASTDHVVTKRADALAQFHHRQRVMRIGFREFSLATGRKYAARYGVEMKYDELVYIVFQKWRDFVRASQHETARLQASQIYFDMRSQIHALKHWHLLAKRQTTLKLGQQHWENEQRRKALLCWCLVASETALHRDHVRLATYFRKRMLGIRMFRQFRLFLECVHKEQQADALCDIHRMKRSWQNWKQMLILASRRKNAISHWRNVAMKHTVNILHWNASECIAFRQAKDLSEQFYRSKLVRMCWDSWVGYTVDNIASQKADDTAYYFWQLTNKRRVVALWKQVLRDREELGTLMYTRAMSRLAHRVLMEWNNLLRAWEPLREELLRKKVHRVLVAWRNQCGVYDLDRFANRIAGTHRRKCLLQFGFQGWYEGARLSQSEKQVNKVVFHLAQLNAKRKIMRGWKQFVSSSSVSHRMENNRTASNGLSFDWSDSSSNQGGFDVSCGEISQYDQLQLCEETDCLVQGNNASVHPGKPSASNEAAQVDQTTCDSLNTVDVVGQEKSHNIVIGQREITAKDDSKLRQQRREAFRAAQVEATAAWGPVSPSSSANDRIVITGLENQDGIDRKYVQHRVGGVGRNQVQHHVAGVSRNQVQPRVGGVGRNQVQHHVAGVGRNKVQHHVAGVGRNKVQPQTTKQRRAESTPVVHPTTGIDKERALSTSDTNHAKVVLQRIERGPLGKVQSKPVRAQRGLGNGSGTMPNGMSYSSLNVKCRTQSYSAETGRRLSSIEVTDSAMRGGASISQPEVNQNCSVSWQGRSDGNRIQVGDSIGLSITDSDARRRRSNTSIHPSHHLQGRYTESRQTHVVRARSATNSLPGSHTRESLRESQLQESRSIRGRSPKHDHKEQRTRGRSLSNTSQTRPRRHASRSETGSKIEQPRDAVVTSRRLVGSEYFAKRMRSTSTPRMRSTRPLTPNGGSKAPSNANWLSTVYAQAYQNY